MRIVFASHTHIGGDFVVGSHHLAREMTRAGHAVAHVSTPITPVHLIRLRDPEIRRRFRLWLRPTQADGVLNIVAAAWVPRSIATRIPALRHRSLMPTRRLKRLLDQHLGGPTDLLLIDQPKLVALIQRLHPRQVVYRPTDLYSTMAGNKGIEYDEADVVERSSVVVATSDAVARHVRGLAGRPTTVVLRNGFQHDHFSQPTSRPPEYHDTRMRAVYVGALDDRFDFALVRRLAGEFSNFDFVLIGPTTPLARQELTGLDNITMLGPREYSDVPAYLQHADVGLMPLSDHPSNAGRSPMKLYEYAASGLPVLVREIPQLRDSTEWFTWGYRDADEAVVRLREIIRARGLTDHERHPIGDTQQPAEPVSERLRDHTWQHIASRLIEIAHDASTESRPTSGHG